jgi:hypothetical protein
MSAILIAKYVEKNIMSKKKLEFTEEEIRYLKDLMDAESENIVYYSELYEGKELNNKLRLPMTIKKKLLDYEGKSNILEAKEEL